MAAIRAVIWRALSAVPLLLRLTRRFAPNPFRYLHGKPLERWLLLYDLGRRSLALANDPATVETVMQDRSGSFPKSAALETLLRPLIGSGVFGQPGGAPVKDARRLFIRALARIPDAEIVAACREITGSYVARWLATGSDKPIAICTELSRLTVDIVSRCTLGNTFDAAESQRFAELFFQYHQRCNPLLLLVSDGRPESTEALVRGMAIRPIGEAMRELMRDRFLSPLLAGDATPLAAPFAGSLREGGLIPVLRAGDTEAGNGESALDEIAVMLLAGHETTASSLSWLLWELARRPGEQHAAANKLLASEPSHTDSEAAADSHHPEPWADIEATALIRALTRETLRLYPPIAFFLREARQDSVFRDKPVARGDFIVVSPWTLHRHRKKWTRPDDFVPERWLEPCPDPARTAFMPFGMGPRTCPGAHFADLEMREILQVILARCRFSLATDAKPKPLGGLTSRPDREILLRVEPRDAGTMH